MLFTSGLKHSFLQCNTMKLTTMLLINATVAIVTYTNGMHPTGDVLTMGPSSSANCLNIKQLAACTGKTIHTMDFIYCKPQHH